MTRAIVTDLPKFTRQYRTPKGQGTYCDPRNHFNPRHLTLAYRSAEMASFQPAAPHLQCHVYTRGPSRFYKDTPRHPRTISITAAPTPNADPPHVRTVSISTPLSFKNFINPGILAECGRDLPDFQLYSVDDRAKLSSFAMLTHVFSVLR